METPSRFFRRVAIAAVLLAAVGMWGCANQLDSDSTRAVLTEHQRDSTLAQSAIPGAATVGRALQRSDEAAARAAALDSLSSP